MADKQFKVIVPGENGSGDQVYYYDTREELEQQFVAAQTNATAKIREQARELGEIKANIEPVPATPVDANTAWRKDFTGQGLGEFFEAPPEVIKQEFAELLELKNKLRSSEVAAAIYQEFPEIHGTCEADQMENGKRITAYLEEHKLQANHANCRGAVAVLEREGKLKVTPADQQANFMPPVPTTVTRPSVQVNTNESRAEFLTNAPLDQVRKLLEKEWAGKQKS